MRLYGVKGFPEFWASFPVQACIIWTFQGTQSDNFDEFNKEPNSQN